MIHSQRGTPSFSKQTQDLSGFDGQRIAVVMKHGGRKMVWKGTALYTEDPNMGKVLRISIESKEAGDPVIVIAEKEWSGRIIPDLEHGCKFCLICS